MELRRERATRVVTLGGGHGQANLLRAMRQLECEIRALVSVVDDGGCSGILRRTLGMPPPGDVRRCLCALAQEPELAEYFESRTPEGRSRGNLMMAELWSHSKNLQNVSDHMGRWLRVEGRIHPVSNSRCTIRAHDRDGNLVEGECEVSQADIDPLSVRVDSFGVANPAAVRAILDADIVLFGPGSLITSVLAAVLSPGIAEALEASTAKKVFIANVTLGSVANDSISAFSFVELLQQHLERRNGKPVDELISVLDAEFCFGKIDDWPIVTGPVRDGDEHDPKRLAKIIGDALELPFRPEPDFSEAAPDGADNTIEPSASEVMP